MVSTSGPAPGLVVHRRLRPGSYVVAREPGVVQVGLDRPRRALLPDRPDVRRVLAALSTGAPVKLDTPAAIAAVAALEGADLVVDGAAPGGQGPDSALLARHGGEAEARRGARAETRVLAEIASGLRAATSTLLDAAGVSLTDDPSLATVALLVHDREPSRQRTDGWMRDGLPHLGVHAHDGGFTVGPFTVPGVTACRRCVDAHLADHDPRRAMVVEQLSREPAPAPYDAVAAGLAVAWAVRDLVRWIEGDRPATWSATLDLETPDAPDVPHPRRWTRHPHCGCSWDAWPLRLAARARADA